MALNVLILKYRAAVYIIISVNKKPSALSVTFIEFENAILIFKKLIHYEFYFMILVTFIVAFKDLVCIMF
uniref:Uncharacterized protein n=1 Tax=Lepeophtheirus salmonis TaxID=72036 RepID=A0A0K2SWN8_LEPSM